MKYFVRGFGLLGLLLAALAVLPTPQALAAEGFNVITSPLPIKLTTAPGTTVQTELRIKNQGSQAEGIKVGLMKFGASGETGQPNLFELTPRDSYASWVHFSPQQFTAQPNVWNTIKMTINVPADAALGYYMAVTYSPAVQPGVKGGTSLKGSAATLVLLDVKSPNEKRALQLADFTADHKVYEYLPANFSIKLRNTGNIYLTSTGNIFILKGNKVIDTLDFNAAGGSVLPQSNRVFKVPWSNGFPVFKDRLVDDKPVTGKDGVLKQDLKWDFSQANKYRFGKYTAKLLIAYDDGKQDVPLESTLTFWVIPWKMLLILLLVLVLIGFGIFVLIRSTFRRAKQGRGKPQHADKK
jgi:hypothetical protein